MNRRHLLSGAAYLLGAAQANAFGIGRLGLGEGSLGVLGGAGNASSFAPYPAPAGFHWDFVTANSERVTSNGEPVVALVGN